MATNHQLIEVSNYDVNRIIFSEPIKGAVPDSPIEYKRINLSTRNEDGTVGDVILPTSRLFSFGVSENRDSKTQEVNGWTLPLCLWNRDGPTQEQRDWTTTFDAIVELAANTPESTGKGRFGRFAKKSAPNNEVPLKKAASKKPVAKKAPAKKAKAK